MAISFNQLKSLSEKPPQEWTPADLRLFGIDVPEPRINPATGVPFLSERLAVQSPATNLKTNLSFLVRGIEFANDPSTTPAELASFGNQRINDFSQRIANTIQQYNGDPTGFLSSQPVQSSLQNIASRAEGQAFTPVQGVGPVDRTPAPRTSDIPMGTLTPAGLSAPPPPIPVTQASAGPVQQTTLTPTTGPQATPQGQSFLTGAQPTGTAMVNPLDPSTLPALRGAATGTSSIDPTLRPYLELGLRGAEQLFLQQQPSLFPGQMFVSPSEQTQAALNMQEDLALAQPTTLQAAQESFMRGLGGIGATAGGAFLMGSPYRQQVIESATRPLVQQFEQTTLPGISSQFSAAGRYGSGAMERAVGTATEATGRAIGDIASNIAYQDYANERQRQQQALGLQLQGATLAPQIYGQQFLPSQQLAQVGAAREAIAAQPLQEAIQRYQFEQQVPYQQLQGFLSSVYGTPMASSQYAPPAQTNRAASTLGGAALGAGVGQMIGGSFGGFSAPAIGAGIGALGGLLF
jgi:hypothetical protein